jgi:hypothetical protein
MAGHRGDQQDFRLLAVGILLKCSRLANGVEKTTSSLTLTTLLPIVIRSIA